MKLRQTGTVEEYLTEFKKLMNRVGWNENTLYECFVSGLNDFIKDEVLSYRPPDLTGAIRLTLIQEDKFNRHKNDSVNRVAPSPRHVTGGEGRRGVVEEKTPIKKLTWEELQERKDKGLCFNCDEKFERGHNCKKKARVFMLCQEDQESESENEDTAEEEVSPDVREFGVSLQAMEGGNTQTTM